MPERRYATLEERRSPEHGWCLVCGCLLMSGQTVCPIECLPPASHVSTPLWEAGLEPGDTSELTGPSVYPGGQIAKHWLMAWQGSTRRARLPHDWAERRAFTLRRNKLCAICQRAPSTEVDHVIRGDDHSLLNLQGLCTACHKTKTDKEKIAARWKPSNRTSRPNEPHPGLER